MVKVILHCSDSGFGNAALISKWHSLPKEPVVQNGKTYQGRGWSGIGYHYVVLNGWLDSTTYNDRFNGSIETGRPLDDDPVVSGKEMGAHVRGHNRGSVGICLIGRSGKFTPKQLSSAVECVYILEQQFGQIEVYQHSDFDSNKPKCAGLDMNRFKRNLQTFKDQIEEAFTGVELDLLS